MDTKITLKITDDGIQCAEVATQEYQEFTNNSTGEVTRLPMTPHQVGVSLGDFNGDTEAYQAKLASLVNPHMPDQATIIAEAQANREKADERKAERDAARTACAEHETTIATLQERIKELEAQLPPAEEPAADHA